MTYVYKEQCRYVLQLQLSLYYRIAQNCDGGNFDIFDTFQLDRQNLTCHIV